MSLHIDETTAVAPGERAAGLSQRRALPAQTAALTTPGLVTVLIGAFLPMTDFFIVNVALPTIDRDLHASAGMLQLVVAGYAIGYALLLVVGGRLGDAVGRKRLFLIGMAAFTVTSLACGIAPGIGVLVAARVLQGAASAMMLPQVLSTIQATTSGQARARALGCYGATGGIASVAGQLLGGLLVSADIGGLGWRPIFLVNVPIGIVGLAMTVRLVPDTRSEDPAPVDVRGTLLLGVATLSLLIPLTEGRSLGWPPWTFVLLIAAPVAAVAFVRAEQALEDRGGVPLVPVSLLRVPEHAPGPAARRPVLHRVRRVHVRLRADPAGRHRGSPRSTAGADPRAHGRRVPGRVALHGPAAGPVRAAGADRGRPDPGVRPGRHHRGAGRLLAASRARSRWRLACSCSASARA